MVSGFKAIPFEEELKFLCRLFPTGTFIGEWFGEIYTGIQVANKDYPFLA